MKSEASLSQLTRLCEDGRHEDLSNLLGQSNEPDNVKLMVGHLSPMIEAAAQSGHTEIVENLLGFGQKHEVPVSEMVNQDTLGAALQCKERPLEVLLKYQAVFPTVFTHGFLHIGASGLPATAETMEHSISTLYAI